MNSLILNHPGTRLIDDLQYASEKIGIAFLAINLSSPGNDLQEQLITTVKYAQSGHKVILALDVSGMTLSESLSRALVDVLCNRRMSGVDIGSIDSVAVIASIEDEMAASMLMPLKAICEVFDARDALNPMAIGTTNPSDGSSIGNVLLARYLLGSSDKRTEVSGQSKGGNIPNP